MRKSKKDQENWKYMPILKGSEERKLSWGQYEVEGILRDESWRLGETESDSWSDLWPERAAKPVSDHAST